MSSSRFLRMPLRGRKLFGSIRETHAWPGKSRESSREYPLTADLQGISIEAKNTCGVTNGGAGEFRKK